MEDEFKTQLQKYSKDVLVDYIIRNHFFDHKETFDELNDIKRATIINSLNKQIDKNLEECRKIDDAMHKAHEDGDSIKWLKLLVKSRNNDEEYHRLNKKFAAAMVRI